MYRAIVVPLDGSPFAEQAVATAVAIAERAGARVTLVRAWDPANYRYTSEMTPPFLDPGAHERVVATEYLDALATRVRTTTTVPIAVAVLAGSAVDAIKEVLTSSGADLVVMTTHGLTGWNRAWIGSVADALIRVTTVPVLLCRPSEPAGAEVPRRFARVLIPLDGSADGEQILPHVAKLIAHDGARCILVRVVHPVGMPVHPYTYTTPAWETDPDATNDAMTVARGYLTMAADRLEGSCPEATVDVDVRLAERTAAAIVETAQDYQADLVALTTHARRGVRLVLGSVADKVLRGTHVSVLVLHPTAERTQPHAAVGRT